MAGAAGGGNNGEGEDAGRSCFLRTEKSEFFKLLYLKVVNI